MGEADDFLTSLCFVHQVHVRSPFVSGPQVLGTPIDVTI